MVSGEEKHAVILLVYKNFSAKSGLGRLIFLSARRFKQVWSSIFQKYIILQVMKCEGDKQSSLGHLLHLFTRLALEPM